jgi:hypothetical protein
MTRRKRIDSRRRGIIKTTFTRSKIKFGECKDWKLIYKTAVYE